MLAYQEGNEVAFTQLYRRHSSKVYGYLATRLKDRALADDAFQATFLKLHQSKAKYDASLPFAPWLFTICRTSMVDVIRSRTRVNENENQNEVAVEMAAAPEKEEAADLPELSALPSAQRQALELRYLESLSFEEISKRLETSPANVRQLVSRAVKRLKLVAQGGTKK